MAEASGGLGHLVTPANWLARIAHDPQHVCERQLAGCGCFLPHLLVGAAGRSLGAASARPFPTVSAHRAIAQLIEPRAVRSISGSLVPQYGTARSAQRFSPPGTDDELGRVMTALCGIDVTRSRISNARRRGRDPEEMRECFGAIPATDEGFIRRLYRTRPDVLRQVLLPLLTPQSAAIRRLEEILAEEDEAELARSKVEWLERFHNAVRDDALIAEFGT